MIDSNSYVSIGLIVTVGGGILAMAFHAGMLSQRVKQVEKKQENIDQLPVTVAKIEGVLERFEARFAEFSRIIEKKQNI